MAQFSILLNKKGTILSFNVMDADPKRFPIKKLTGRHFSLLVGVDCKKDLRHIMKQTSKTRKPSSFRTFLAAARGAQEGPIVEWTLLPKSGYVLLPSRYLLIGKDPE
jgi:hypothetical protein